MFKESDRAQCKTYRKTVPGFRWQNIDSLQ